MVRMWRKERACAFLLRTYIGAVTMENSMKLSQNNKKIELSWDTAILLLDIHLKETKAGCQRDNCSPLFSVALFTTANTRRQPTCHQQRDGQRRCGLHAYNGILFRLKKSKSCCPWQHGWTLRALRQVQLSQRKTSSAQFHVYVESKRAELTETE